MDSIDREELEECYNDLMDAFQQFKDICKRHDRRLYERWSAGGQMVSNDFVGMYPSSEKVYESLMELPEEDDDEEDSELEVSCETEGV